MSASLVGSEMCIRDRHYTDRACRHAQPKRSAIQAVHPSANDPRPGGSRGRDSQRATEATV
eukprot:2111356-Alexandrium_andersonii.AAC.1